MGYYLTMKAEYKSEEQDQLDIDNLNGEGVFNLISELIRQIFSRYPFHNQEQIRENMQFLESKLVSMYCDCSEILDQETLISMYYKKLKYNERQSL